MVAFKPLYNELKRDVPVSEWYLNLRHRSPITGDTYLRTLGLYCKLNKITPWQILEDARTGKLRSDFIKFVEDRGKEGKAGSYVARFKRVLNSWVSHNGLDANLRLIWVPGENISPTLTEERPPSKDEIDSMLRNATVRGRAVISLLAFSGLRPESLGNYDGSDALRLKDLEGLKIKQKGVEFSTVPAVLRVRQSKVQLSKKGHPYFTFVPEQTLKYLKDYFKQRILNGEVLAPDSPVIRADSRGSNTRKSGILATLFLERDVRSAIKKSGLKFRPYVLRVYFSSAMDVCEANNLVSHNWREFWFGHKGDISARYSTNKVLPKETIEAMRDKFKKCCRYLETEKKPPEEDETERKAKETMLVIAGFTRQEIGKENLLEMGAEELGKMVREKMLGGSASNGHKQEVIQKREAKHYLEDLRYEFVANLNDSEIIVKRPDEI